MKRGIKVLIGVIILVVILVIAYVMLVIAKILPNPFIKEDKLVCIYNYPGTEDSDEYVFLFDKNDYLIKYIERQISVYSSEKEAKKAYQQLNSVSKDETIVQVYDSKKIELIENRIIMEFVFIINEDSDQYRTMKDQILEEYKVYECK